MAVQQQNDEATKPTQDTSTTTVVNNAIPTSPQYGVTIISTNANNDIPIEATTAAVNTITESVTKIIDNNNSEHKEMHSTPSKNDRFKVVKIASSEPFRRGRWKCMDYVDQVPPTTNQQTKTNQSTGVTGVQIGSGVYMQTQSLPPQQIQQLLLQSALCAVQPQYFQNNMQSQILPQTQQYFYPAAVQNQNNVQQQIMNQSGVVQPQFLNQQQQQQQQQYFQASVVQPGNFQNVQFVQPGYPNQPSAFVPTTQNIQNFQQAQTYGGQPTVTQQNVVQNQSQPASVTQPQPIVNGYAYPSQNITEQQLTANNLPNQVAKSVIINSNPNNNQVIVQQNQQPESQSVNQNSVVRNQVADQPPNNQTFQQHPQISIIPNVNPMQNVVVLQSYDPHQTNDVYANPQFVASVHSIPIMESTDAQVSEGSMDVVVANSTGENTEDSSKTNPVVNAIDNKIEQAMDLVKSHLMYTVREEVEVLKEKIAELMERIQQLESENNFLRSQLPKSNPNGTSEPSSQQ